MLICIIYEDGAVIVGSVEGIRAWGRELNRPLHFVKWSPNRQSILLGVLNGIEAGIACGVTSSIGCEWYQRISINYTISQSNWFFHLKLQVHYLIIQLFFHKIAIHHWYFLPFGRYCFPVCRHHLYHLIIV